MDAVVYVEPLYYDFRTARGWAGGWSVAHQRAYIARRVASARTLGEMLRRAIASQATPPLAVPEWRPVDVVDIMVPPRRPEPAATSAPPPFVGVVATGDAFVLTPYAPHAFHLGKLERATRVVPAGASDHELGRALRSAARVVRWWTRFDAVLYGVTQLCDRLTWRRPEKRSQWIPPAGRG
jgi:hypothetical protein